MQKEVRAKICGVLISFYKVMKLQSFELSVSDVMPANGQNISQLVFFAYFCSFYEERV